ncbi:TonB-dependent receptor domain-containing protein [Aureitalea marina]|uniref:TonB-dependent receptor n=1 Tax=Aureitalea marina TaxID=930804 RepID=A0A2S7KMW1_9FLAO|nr:TonB-dependent receptor [Aureitalea marina]PQB03942.1 TonB-dependent receptor [Aureitalea marina]
MRSKVYKHSFLFAITLMWCAQLLSQSVLSGRVGDPDQGIVIANAEVYLVEEGLTAITDSNGEFSFSNLNDGTYRLVIFSLGYDLLEETTVVQGDSMVYFQLQLLGETLTEVVLSRQKERIFTLKQLKSVEGTAIYESKKSEVVLVDNLTANLATSNARQVYSRVAGLNIFENNDAGLQLNIGGRGLNPNRTANFNTRQNGYDISADVLGYPESYYTPPAESISEIQVVRGAASLQYGTQFGGLVNFKMHQPNRTEKIEWTSRQTLGSYDLLTSFNSLSGQLGKLGYYTYFNYKRGNDFRPNSQFESYNAFAHLDYELGQNTTLTGEFSYLNYLAQQPGGMTDAQFEEDPSFSNRERNWFEVDWKLYSLRLDHRFSSNTDFSLNLFGLDASRKAVGFRENRVSQPDQPDAPRELIDGRFNNWGAEARLLTRYEFLDRTQVLLIGTKYYQSNNSERQGPGSNGSDANFDFADDEYPNYPRQSDFDFPNLNLAFFGENIFKLSREWSITPGFRWEYIRTESEGAFKKINLDNAGNPILNETIRDDRVFERNFVLFGLGVSYRPENRLEFYGNISQNYRSVTFNDIRVTNPSLTVDPNISDEEGFTADLGLRGQIDDVLRFDVSAFFLSYRDRLGVVVRAVSDIEEERFRSNIGDAITYGLETFGEWDIRNTFSWSEDWNLSLFSNLALTGSEYTSSELNNVEGNKVEYVPLINWKTGLNFGYRNLAASLQWTYLSEQFTDATNSERDFESQSGIVGEIPSYGVMDLSFNYTWRFARLETGLNNVLDNSYFVRRATGYPGPGIIPSQPRTWYLGLQLTF